MSNYSEIQLKNLAQTNPKELIRILTIPNGNIHTLSFGAELLGEEVQDEELTIPVLKQLLKHVNAVVREGALIGISAFCTKNKPPQDLLDKIKMISINDPSPTLKEMARDFLKDI